MNDTAVENERVASSALLFSPESISIDQEENVIVPASESYCLAVEMYIREALLILSRNKSRKNLSLLSRKELLERQMILFGKPTISEGK